MLKRLVLATFFGLCVSGVAYGQGGDRECASCDRADARMASVEPTAQGQTGTFEAAQKAYNELEKAVQSGNREHMRGAAERFRDAENARVPSAMPSSVEAKDLPVSREVEKTKDWDRRMGEGRDRDSDRGRDGGDGPRDNDRQRDAARDRDTNMGRDNKP